MAGATKVPISGHRLSRNELKKTLGGKSSLFEFLNYYAIKDTVYYDDDFPYKAINATNNYTVAAGASATTWASTAGENGFIRGVVGATAATSGLQLLFPVIQWSGANNAGVEIRWRTSVITEIRFEFGLVDALPAVNTNIVNNLATPTFNTTTHAALYLYDNAAAVTTMGLYGIGTAVAANVIATTTNAPVANTWQRVRIQCIGALAFLWVDGVNLAPAGVNIASADDSYLALSLKGSDTNAKNVDIDLIEAWADRSG